MSEKKLMQGKVILITGATDGIGKETAKRLAAMGGEIVIAGRNQEKAENVIEEIKSFSGNNKLSYLLADLSSQAQIRQLAEDFRSKYNRLDALINNAGSIFLQRKLSVDGIEMTFAVNHLSYFLLSNLLLDLLKKNTPSRIVLTSSGSHLRGKINFDNINLSKKYFFQSAYAQSNLANVMFTIELARRIEGSGVTTNCFHPGFVKTNMAVTDNKIVGFFKPLIFRTGIPVEEGAETAIFLTSSPDLDGVSGKYFYKKKERDISPKAKDIEGQKRLWDLSEKLVGV